ncbi:MAG: hypothetical protein V1703_03355, partial [Candidatus Altiarchaeota archaeon]
MDPMVFILILFTVITVVLFKTKYERFLLFFMIRTRMGIRLIKSIARVNPRFWKFMGDLGILASFSGIGVLYLSRSKESKGNLYSIIAILMLTSTLFSGVSLPLRLVSIAMLAIAFIIMRKIDNRIVNFIVTSLLISLTALDFVPGLRVYYAMLLGFLGFPALVIAALIQQAYDIFQGSMLPGISPMLPSTKEGNIGVGFPGYDIFIPW